MQIQKRVLTRSIIFLLSFPAMASLVFYAALYVLTGAVVDSVLGPMFKCFLFTLPAVAMALIDLVLERLSPVVVTAAVGYGLAALSAMTVLGAGLNAQVLTLGLIGGLPALACSSLARLDYFHH